MTGLAAPDGAMWDGPQIVQAIEDEVVSGRWPPGHRLPSERSLSDMFSVSRPVVREALSALSERGLITISAGRGSFVQVLNPASAGGSAELLARRGVVRARDLVEARTMLEAETAALAARHRTEQQLAEMRSLLGAFERSSVPASADLDLAFHELIAVASHNPVLQVMFASIRSLTHAIMLRSLTDRVVTGIAVPLHNVILDAIAQGDADLARASMTEHIGAAVKYYGPDLDRPLADVLRRRADLTPSLASVLRDVSRLIEPGTDHPWPS